jgi:hypothetical protein
MQIRRAAPALSLATALLLASIGSPFARAQTSPDSAADQRDQAYRLVDERVAERDQVEGRLVEALIAYQQAAEDLSAANARLSRVEEKLVLAQARAAELTVMLQTTAINAYVDAVGGSSGLFLAGTRADAFLVAAQVLQNVQGTTREEIDQITAIQNELSRLETGYTQERDTVADLTATLAEKNTELQALFAVADAAVADAYRRALEAETAYRAALSAAEAARSAREAEERKQAASQSSPPTTPGSTPTPANGGTTTPPGGTIKIRPSTEAWRPVVAAHFPADRVDEALAIIQCESGGDPGIVNPYSGAAGLFQFLPGTWAAASVSAGVGDRSVFDGEANIIAAAWLSGYYASRGYSPWQPWACRWYL